MQVEVRRRVYDQLAAHDAAHRKDCFQQLLPNKLILTSASPARKKLEDICISPGATTIGSKHFQPSKVVDVVSVNSILHAQLNAGEAGSTYR
jgi:hypothetical protein